MPGVRVCRKRGPLQWLTVAAGVALALGGDLSERGARAESTNPVGHLWDEAQVLSPSDRAAIEARLAAAAGHSDSPLFIVLSPQLPPNTLLSQRAERLFFERVRPATDRPDPVLLMVVAAGPHPAAALATGKGIAGIVPEIDAGGITRPFQRRNTPAGLKVALANAIDAVVRSAGATAERRRPLPADDEAIPVSAVPTAPSSDPPASATAAPTTPASGGSRTRLPLAIAAAAIIVIALALRRRKQHAANQLPPPPAVRPRLPTRIDVPTPDRRRRGDRSSRSD